MADTKKKNVFQRIAEIAKEFQEWVEETFGDAELAAEIKDGLGLDPSNPATPGTVDPQRKAKIDAFVAKEDVDEAALAEVIEDIKATVDTVIQFIEAAKADAVDPWNLFWPMFNVFAVQVLRVRNPAGYAVARLGGLVTEDDETLNLLDAGALTKLLRGESDAAVDGEAWVQRFSMLGGVTVVLLANFWDWLNGVIDAMYGWDPDPEDEGESAVVAGRALTAVLENDVLGGVRPALTLIGVPSGHGGPGLFVSATPMGEFPMDVGDTTYTLEIAGAGQFGLFIPFKDAPVRSFASFNPSIRVKVEPRQGAGAGPSAPALVFGTTDATRLEVGSFAFGVEIGSDRAGFRAGIRKGKLVVALGDGDSFLRQLPGGNVEVPFDIGIVADTANGIRFEGGTGLRVNLPVSASLFGVFTVQFLELDLKLTTPPSLDLAGGFSLQLGPFQASIDRAGLRVQLDALRRGVDDLGDLVQFAPPKGIGLTLDAGVVKGGGYLFIDAARGEYAGALELKFLNFSIKAIGLLSTKRPDGSEGWSLLLFVFGQFSIHIAFGIFWTGLGGMVGLHHRADVDALTAGMRTGALDDVLFPANPVADAPRIINRYRTLFPVSEAGFLVGPMLELSFSQPPVVFIRIGLIADARNALGGDRPAALSRVILLGQILVQLPPRDTGAPAILKLLVDVVGFYDADTKFLLIRARLRDSFVGIQGLAKLDLAGEMLVAAQFGSDPTFVLSVGGFHPKFQDLPERVPRDLERLRSSFKLGPVKLSIEQYFAVTPNSVQAGWKASLSADFGVASIEASLAFDALFYLSPRFYFVVDVEFRAKVKAFGETLASVRVNATIEGPDQWHVFGKFSFSILWWDKSVSFDERWGEVREVDTGTVTLAATLAQELANPDNLAPEGPVGGESLITLAAASTDGPVVHPLGRLAIRQKAVPFGLRIDRLGTKRIAGGPTTVTVGSVRVNGQALPSFDSTMESFARGQFMELSDTERLTGQSFETFACGVVVGRADYETAPSHLTRDVKAAFETVRLDPEPKGVMTKWSRSSLGLITASHGAALSASKLGGAARSERAKLRQRSASPLAATRLSVQDAPLAVVDPTNLKESATLLGPAAKSPTLAGQVAAGGGGRVVEAYEVVR